MLRAHVGSGSEQSARARRTVESRHAWSRRRRPAMGLAIPKSRTFTRPESPSFTFAGLRSRCTIPLRCASWSASAICTPISDDLGHGEGAAPQPLQQGLALDQLQDEIALTLDHLETVDGAHVGMIQGGEQPRLALDAAQASRLLGKVAGHDLDRHLAAERGIERAVDAAHAPLFREDLAPRSARGSRRGRGGPATPPPSRARPPRKRGRGGRHRAGARRPGPRRASAEGRARPRSSGLFRAGLVEKAARGRREPARGLCRAARRAAPSRRAQARSVLSRTGPSSARSQARARIHPRWAVRSERPEGARGFRLLEAPEEAAFEDARELRSRSRRR